MEEETKKHQKKREKKVILKNKRRKKMSMEAETATNSSTSSTGRASFSTVTLEEAFALTEGNGRATWFYGMFFSLGYSLTGFFSYVLPFLGKYPAFEWMDNPEAGWYAWTRETVCDNQHNTSKFQYRYDWTSAETIDNWITSMKLEWIPSYKIGLIGSLYFLGFWIGAATLLRIADIKGRKPMLIFSFASTIVITFGYVITNSLLVAYILTFLNGLVLAVRISLCYMYMMEFAPMHKKKTINMLGAIWDSTCIIVIAIYYYYIKFGESMFHLYLVHSSITLVILFKIPESPQFLYSKKRWKELHDWFDQICYLNQSQKLGVKFDREDLDDTQEEVKADTSLRALLCDDKSRLINLLVMVFNWSVCSFCFYVIGFFIKYFRGSMYTNAMMMGAADIIASIGVRVAQMHISTKKGFIISYIWIFLVTIIYLLFERVETLIPIFILCMRLGVTFAFGLSYFGNAEYFPPIFLSTVFGICNIFARMSTIFSPMVAEVVPEPILIITILSITATMIATFLRTPHKEGSFASAGQKGKIAFVQDSAVDGKDFNLELDHKPADGLEEVKKELFLLEEEDDEDINHDFNGGISDKQIPSVSDE